MPAGALRQPKSVKRNNSGYGGAQRNLYRQFYRDVYQNWRVNGQHCIEVMIEEKPEDFVRLVAGMMPKQFQIDHTPPDRSLMVERIITLAEKIADQGLMIPRNVKETQVIESTTVIDGEAA